MKVNDEILIGNEKALIKAIDGRAITLKEPLNDGHDGGAFVGVRADATTTTTEAATTKTTTTTTLKDCEGDPELQKVKQCTGEGHCLWKGTWWHFGLTDEGACKFEKECKFEGEFKGKCKSGATRRHHVSLLLLSAIAAGIAACW